MSDVAILLAVGPRIVAERHKRTQASLLSSCINSSLLNLPWTVKPEHHSPSKNFEQNPGRKQLTDVNIFFLELARTLKTTFTY